MTLWMMVLGTGRLKASRWKILLSIAARYKAFCLLATYESCYDGGGAGGLIPRETCSQVLCKIQHIRDALGFE